MTAEKYKKHRKKLEAAAQELFERMKVVKENLNAVATATRDCEFEGRRHIDPQDLNIKTGIHANDIPDVITLD